MTFNEADVNRKQDGKFGEKTGAGPEITLDQNEQKTAHREAAFRAMYFGNSKGLEDAIVGLDSLGEPLDATKLKERVTRSRSVLLFDKNWSLEHGIGGNEDARRRAIQKELGLSEMRYTQILVANPEVKDAQGELEAEGVERHERAAVMRERMFGAKRNPVRHETKRVTQDRFDEWEVKHERETGISR